MSTLESTQHIYYGQPYARVDLNPVPESTLSPSGTLDSVSGQTFRYPDEFWGRIQRKLGVWGDPIAGADFNLTLCPIQHIMATLCQSRLYLGFGLYSRGGQHNMFFRSAMQFHSFVFVVRKTQLRRFSKFASALCAIPQLRILPLRIPRTAPKCYEKYLWIGQCRNI